jgi:hypothetical protein
MEWLHRFDDAGINILFDGGASDADGISKGSGRRIAVGFDADAIDAQQRGAAVFVGAGSGLHSVERTLGKQCPGNADRRFI